ncbi:MAG: threonine/serine exporter family protein [Opitutaceae bacterium]
MTVWHFPGIEATVNPPLSGNMWVVLLENMAIAAVPAVGFALLFNVPTHALGYCAAGGAIGRGLRYLLVTGHMPIELATFIAAGVVSILGVYIAQRMRAHPKVFTVSAMIPMIPGVPFFTALIAVLEIQRQGFTQELLAAAVTSGLRAAFIVAALAVGLAIPGLLFYRRRPVV